MDDKIENSIVRPNVSRKLHVFGLALTASWIVAMAAYVFVSRTQFIAMKPFETADFFGGAFAPLAFLWLVLGFFQQGEELRHSADALWLQGKELQNSVEQQRELVSVTREQLQFESDMLKAQQEEVARRSRPIIELRQGPSMSAGNGLRSHTFRVANVGKPATSIKAFIDEKIVTTSDILQTGHQIEFNRDLPVGEIEPFVLRIAYLDERGLAGDILFQVSGTNRFDIVEIAGQSNSDASTGSA